MKKLIAISIIFILALSFAGCKKEPVVLYDPEIPQEWIDATEEEAKKTTTGLTRTNDFNGVWKHKESGDYFHCFEGTIYVIDNLNPSLGKTVFWGTTQSVQEVEKTFASGYDYTIKNEFNPGDTLVQYYSSSYAGESLETITTVIDSTHTKTVTSTGREFNFEFVKEVDGPPSAYDIGEDEEIDF